MMSSNIANASIVPFRRETRDSREIRLQFAAYRNKGFYQIGKSWKKSLSRVHLPYSLTFDLFVLAVNSKGEIIYVGLSEESLSGIGLVS